MNRTDHLSQFSQTNHACGVFSLVSLACGALCFIKNLVCRKFYFRVFFFSYRFIGIENNWNSNTQWSQRRNLYNTAMKKSSNNKPFVKSNLVRYQSKNQNSIPKQNNVRQLTGTCTVSTQQWPSTQITSFQQTRQSKRLDNTIDKERSSSLLFFEGVQQNPPKTLSLTRYWCHAIKMWRLTPPKKERLRRFFGSINSRPNMLRKYLLHCSLPQPPPSSPVPFSQPPSSPLLPPPLLTLPALPRVVATEVVTMVVTCTWCSSKISPALRGGGGGWRGAAATVASARLAAALSHSHRCRWWIQATAKKKQSRRGETGEGRGGAGSARRNSLRSQKMIIMLHPEIHIHTRTRTHKHTHTHTQAHICTHTYAHTHAHTQPSITNIWYIYV